MAYIPQLDEPIQLTTETGCVVTEQDWQSRQALKVAGTDEGSVMFAVLLLNIGLEANLQTEFELEGEAGFRGVSPPSAEVTLLLQGTDFGEMMTPPTAPNHALHTDSNSPAQRSQRQLVAAVCAGDGCRWASFVAKEKALQLKVHVSATKLPPAASPTASTAERPGGLYLGVQHGEAVEQVVPTVPGEATFELSFAVAQAQDGKPNFTGPYAKGTRDERFFYLVWLVADAAGSCARYGRAKVHLSHLTWPEVEAAALSERTACVSLKLTDAKGCPKCGSIRASDQGWSM